MKSSSKRIDANATVENDDTPVLRANRRPGTLSRFCRALEFMALWIAADILHPNFTQVITFTMSDKENCGSRLSQLVPETQQVFHLGIKCYCWVSYLNPTYTIFLSAFVDYITCTGWLKKRLKRSRIQRGRNLFKRKKQAACGLLFSFRNQRKGRELFSNHFQRYS